MQTFVDYVKPRINYWFDFVTQYTANDWQKPRSEQGGLKVAKTMQLLTLQ